MATSFYFNNRQVMLPGVYSTITTNETTPARNLDFGTCLIIDTGVYGATWGGGSGIDGENYQGQDSVYTFDNLADFRDFVKGGMFYKLAEPLFTPDPSNPAATGISNLMYVRACETTSATLSFTTTNGGSFVVKTLDEGVGANGVLTTGGNLSKGYGFSVETGVDDPTKWILKFWVGTFTGLAADGYPINEISEEKADPQLILQSPEFNNIQTLIDWARSDATFANIFVLDSTSEAEGDGTVEQTDITSMLDGNNYVLATGGTEDYDATKLDMALEAIAGLDYSFVFMDQFGTNANSTLTQAYIAHMNSAAKYSHFLFVGGYGEKAQFSQSLQLAQGFDSDYIQLVHGDVGTISGITGVNIRWWGVMYNLCALLGRCAGKPPYIPLTNKTIGVDKLKHTLTDSEKEKALTNGVLVTVYNDYTRKFVCLQGVNTLQDNTSLFNSKAQSFSIQFMRVVAQINKELVVNASIDLLGQENGVNVNTLSAGAVKDWTVAYLQSRVATDSSDNLLLAFQDVTVTQQEDAWFVTYKIRVNNEINKLFFTGFLIR